MVVDAYTSDTSHSPIVIALHHLTHVEEPAPFAIGTQLPVFTAIKLRAPLQAIGGQRQRTGEIVRVRQAHYGIDAAAQGRPGIGTLTQLQRRIAHQASEIHVGDETVALRKVLPQPEVGGLGDQQQALLTFLLLLLRAHAWCDVDQCANQGIACISITGFRAPGFEQVANLTLAVDNAILQCKRAVLGNGIANGVADVVHIVGINDAGVAAHRVVDELTRGIPCQVFYSVIHVQHGPVLVRTRAVHGSRDR